LLLAFGLLVSQVAFAQEQRGAGVETTGFDAVDARLIKRGMANLNKLKGKPVRAVSVETVGKRWRSKPVLRSVEIGAPLNADLARRAMRELLDGGGFAQAYADARAYEGGVILRIVAVPRRIVAGIRTSGAVLDLDRTLRATEIGVDSEITEPGLKRMNAAIRRFYRRFGYDDASLTIEPKDTDDPMEVLLEIEIEPGERREVTRRIFVIEPRYDRELGDTKYEYEVETGDEVDEDALIDADNEMVDLLRGEDFLDAIVKHRVLRRGPDSFLYVYLETGPRYRFVFEGNKRRDDDDLKDALELNKPSTDTTPDALGEKLRRWYQDRGFYDARVQAESERLENGAIVEVRFQLNEGELVRVARRILPCLPATPPEGLSPQDLSDEMDAVIEATLPSMPLFHEIDEAAAYFSSDRSGSRARARRLEPALTYTPESYERAVKHIEELLNSRGYLNAVVGPVSVMRAECDPRARGGVCRPLELPQYQTPICRRDALELPIPEEPLDEAFTCVPDMTRSIHCAPTMGLHIPIQLGPQMRLYDIVFEGNKVVDSKGLLETTGFEPGKPFSNIELDAAQARVLEDYRNRGYAYATVRTEVDYSPDRTRARARFIINEHKPVIIEGYEVRGAHNTDIDLIISRLELCQDLEACSDEEKYFKRDLVRESEEQIATLGTFSSVSIALEDPEIPQERKRVIITVSELPSQYIEPSGGFYTGDGFRVGLEYGHRNIGGQAIALTVRLEFSILPDFLILDDDVAETYEEFTVSERLERRNTLSLRFPNIGLGPRVDLVVNGVDARDNNRDFGLTREAFFPTTSYRPVRQVNLQLGVSTELNDVTLFNTEDVAVADLPRVPDGRTIAFAQRTSVTWDRRNKPLAATSGTLASAAVEHVSALPLDTTSQITSEFLKLTGRFAGYIPFGSSGLALAMSLAGGYNLQLKDDSATYPDRLFYLGGVNSVRGFQLDEVVPEDIAARIRNGEIVIDEVGVRGGDFFINPRAELRIPLTDLFSTALFLDTGNVWAEPEAITGLEDLFILRYTAGAGIRLETPLGPVALDYGFKIVRNEWEDFGALHFSIGLF
jgi:outer membrane protein insertion porin family